MAKINLFIDANIIIDLLADRMPFSNSAYTLFEKVNSTKWSLFTSSNSILTTYYIIEKNSNSKQAKKAIKTVLSRLRIVDISKADLLEALTSKIEDYEDACQEKCANKVSGLNYIITKDKKGFKHSKFESKTAEQFLVEEGFL